MTRDKKVSQLAKEVAKLKKNSGRLPSDTLKNPSHQSCSSSISKNAHISAITIKDNLENTGVEEFEIEAPLISIKIDELRPPRC